MSKHKKDIAREREARRRQQQAQQQAGQPRSATITPKLVDALPEGAALIEEHGEWSYYADADAKAYVVVKRPDGRQQIYVGRSAYTFMNISKGMRHNEAREAARKDERKEANGPKGVVVVAMREEHTALAMNEPLRVAVLDPRSGKPTPIYEVLPSELALMVVNCLDGKQTQLFGLLEGATTFNKRLDRDGTVLVETNGGMVLDLYITVSATASQLEVLRQRAEAAQEAMDAL